jgi:large subunit ribosomal protein L28
MAKRCQLTGKKTRTGNNVSHSKRSTKRTFAPNLQEKKLVNPATGRVMKVKISTSALRTLKKWQAEGRQYDLKKLLIK